MKAILIAFGGFKKEVHLDEITPVFEFMRAPKLGFDTVDPTKIITVEKMTFFYEKSFYDEDDNKVLVYKERP